MNALLAKNSEEKWLGSIRCLSGCECVFEIEREKRCERIHKCTRMKDGSTVFNTLGEDSE